jgi:ubiquitin carboxyl-terminal hydrolase 5/13
VEHYEKTNHPLSVKLGTITNEGKADVFSYPEETLVIDTKLEQHLNHFNYDMKSSKKVNQKNF